MIKAVLFDLDGTLLPMDYEEFLREYMALIGSHTAHLVNPRQLMAQLLASMAVMVADTNADRTNEAVFAADFYPRLGIDAAILAPVLEDFYRNRFPLLIEATQPSAAARQAVQAVISRGLPVVVATNPIFPEMAIHERLRWAGVADLPFCHVTCYEKSHFCKPNPAYYLEVAAQIGQDPRDCLMVGNDVEEDLAAALVGMKTFLVTDCVVNTKGLTACADRQGSLAELAAWLQSGNLFEGNEHTP